MSSDDSKNNTERKDNSFEIDQYRTEESCYQYSELLSCCCKWEPSKTHAESAKKKHNITYDLITPDYPPNDTIERRYYEYDGEVHVLTLFHCNKCKMVNERFNTNDR